MKRNRFVNLIIILIFQLFALTVVGETTGPPDPGGEPETGDPPLGGGAPVGESITMLFVMAAAYGGKKVFDQQREDKQNS